MLAFSLLSLSISLSVVNFVDRIPLLVFLSMSF